MTTKNFAGRAKIWGSRQKIAWRRISDMTYTMYQSLKTEVAADLAATCVLNRL
jgi:hypothetical protein